MKMLITNNPMVRDNYPEAEFFDTDYPGILKIARDRIHLGHELLSHPKTGNLKSGKSPYKTIVMSAKKENPMGFGVDERSLLLIEDSIESCKIERCKIERSRSSAGDERAEKANSKILLDYQLLDYQLIDYDLIFSGGF